MDLALSCPGREGTCMDTWLLVGTFVSGATTFTQRSLLGCDENVQPWKALLSWARSDADVDFLPSR